MKRLYGLIGRTLSHSFSATYFARKFAAGGEFEGCEYRNFELPTIDDIVRMLDENPDLCGFNVTIPYKRDIFRYLDTVSDEARRIGAVNCVKIDGEVVKIECELQKYDFSAHADHSQIVDFVKACDPDNVIIMHSEAREAFLDDLSDYNVILPQTGEEFELDV